MEEKKDMSFIHHYAFCGGEAGMSKMLQNLASFAFKIAQFHSCYTLSYGQRPKRPALRRSKCADLPKLLR